MPRLLVIIFCFSFALLLGCAPGRYLTVGGYTTEPPFDPNIRSVYIPTFKLNTFITSPYRGIDVDVTEAVVREITSRKTPMRIVSDPSRADTELIGTITQITKTNYVYNVLGFSRDTEIAIQVAVVWRDLRSGEVLTNPGFARQPKTGMQPGASPFDPSAQVVLPKLPDEVDGPVSIVGKGRMLPEIGESNLTAANMATASVARQIVNLMERPW